MLLKLSGPSPLLLSLHRGDKLNGDLGSQDTADPTNNFLFRSFPMAGCHTHEATGLARPIERNCMMLPAASTSL
jgi:hypothetical protein